MCETSLHGIYHNMLTTYLINSVTGNGRQQGVVLLHYFFETASLLISETILLSLHPSFRLTNVSLVLWSGITLYKSQNETCFQDDNNVQLYIAPGIKLMLHTNYRYIGTYCPNVTHFNSVCNNQAQHYDHLQEK